MPGVLADYKEQDIDPPETCSAALSETTIPHVLAMCRVCLATK